MLQCFHACWPALCLGKQRRQFSEHFKFKVALEAAKGLRTVNEIASDYSVHPNQVSTWKKRLLEEGSGVFSRKRGREQQAQAEQEAPITLINNMVSVYSTWTTALPYGIMTLIISNHIRLDLKARESWKFIRNQIS